MSNGVKGTIPCVLIGGPLDGAKYGDLPDTGMPLTGFCLSVPLSQPADINPHAVYRCVSDVPHNGLWPFEFERIDPPAVRLEEAPAGTTLSNSHAAKGVNA